jgi:glycosyltransferase involved in cell wall biosynthesis
MIAQLVHTLSYGDAISTEVLGLQRCFEEAGREAAIYAINVHPRLHGRARDYRELPENFSGELIMHYSLGSPLNALYRSMKNASRSIIYHNLTPSDWFWPVNPKVAKDIEEGIAELPELLRLSDRVLADSPFNAGELRQYDIEAEVLELPIDPKRWEGAANAGVADLLRNQGGIHLLHVGRFAPNKCVEDVLKVFYFLHHHLEPNSTLWLVGIDIDTELYSFSIKQLAQALRLDHAVRFVGCMSDEEVRALYENSSAYICMSEHEGFCLPVIEAMHFGLPVLAYASSALPQTIGNGGILFSEKRHAELAELILTITKDAELRERLIRAGRARVQDLSFESFRQRVQELFMTPAVQALQAGA